MASIIAIYLYLMFVIFETLNCDIIWDVVNFSRKYDNISINDDNPISRPQIGSIQKLFETLGITYEITDNFNFEEYYKQYKNDVYSSEIFEIQSQNFPKPYPVNTITKYLISAENSTGIDFIIHTLDINAEKDFLRFTPINENNNRPVLILTGKQTVPIKFRLFYFGKLQIDFGAYTDKNHNNSGFLLTYKLYVDNEFNSTIRPPPTLDIPHDNLDDTQKIIIVPEYQQANNTWEKFRNLLCNATNEWINGNRLPLKMCHINNVTLKSIIKCPSYYKNHLTCIKLTFSISIYLNEERKIPVNPLVEESEIKYPDALTKLQLEYVWSQYAKEIFQNNGIYEYDESNTTNASVSVWIGISIGIVAIVLLVLFIVCRSNLLKICNNSLSDNNETYKNDMKEKTVKFDITMIPTPEQIIPDVVERYTNDLYDTNSIRIGQNINTVNQDQEIRKNSLSSIRKNADVLNPGFDPEDEKITLHKSNEMH